MTEEKPTHKIEILKSDMNEEMIEAIQSITGAEPYARRTPLSRITSLQSSSVQSPCAPLATPG